MTPPDTDGLTARLLTLMGIDGIAVRSLLGPAP